MNMLQIHKGKTQKQIYKNNMNINPRQLNINILLKKNNSKYNKNVLVGNITNSPNINSDITFINNIFNNNALGNLGPQKQINKYNIVKYLGEGINGSLYLANDAKKKRYICKKIIVDKTTNSEQLKQIEFEINILKYLSNIAVSKKHINPCLEYKIIENNIFTIFPVFDGYSLNHMSKYIRTLDHNSYYTIIFHLIKTILYGLANIHQSKIAHQNINDNSILVSTYKKPSEINVKFTDFGLGCGYNNNISSNMINVNGYDDYNEGNKLLFKYNSCKLNNFTPVIIDDKVMTELIDSDYLVISQKYDLLCLGAIFIKLLLFFDNINIDLSKGYNKMFIKNILELIDEKYLSKKEKEKENNNNMFPSINVNNNVKNDIIEYIKLFKEYVLCKTAHRKTCQYLLDKIIIYEKYKNEVF